MTVGLDTSFLLKLYGKDKRARELAGKLASGEWRGVVSAVSWYEFPRVLMRRGISYGEALDFLKTFCLGVRVAELSRETFARASKLSATFALPAKDSLILTSLLEEGCEAIVTTDSDFKKVSGLRLIYV